MDISIIIPTLNEEKNLPIILDDITTFFKNENYKYELIVVDGQSNDNTVKTAKTLGAKVLTDNNGKGSALRKGMEYAKGDIIITMDADCSNTAREIGLLVEGIKAGYDICMGSRFIQGGGTKDMPPYRKIGNKFFVLTVNLIWGMNYSDLCYSYRSLRKNCIRKLNLESDGFGIETEMAIKAGKQNMKVLEVPSCEKLRRYGKGKLRTFRDGWQILKTILNEFFYKS